MSIHRIACFGVFLVCVLAPAAAFPQPATGTIAGAVRDTTGAVLPGVTVEAASPALIEKTRAVVTDNDGQYKIVDLRPGTYTVTFTLAGFSTLKRDGVELTTGFTATVNAEMRVGTLAETLTVTGASPVVDVQDTRAQNVLTRTVLDAVPTAKNFAGYSALTLGAVSASATGARDVGGNAGEFASAMAIHGSRADGLFSFDGLPSQSLLGDGQLRRIVVNQAAVQEVVVQTSAMTAETQTGGVTVNIVPKDGGNTFHGMLFADYTGSKLQASNVDAALRSRGVSNPNVNKRIYDVNGGIGGPLLRDRLWFYEANRRGDAQQALANTYFNQRQGTLFYAPDLTRPAYTDSPVRDFFNLRVTWQVSPKNKVTGAYAQTTQCLCFLSVGATRSPEAAWSGYFPEKLVQGSWRNIATNKLLFEASGVWRDDSENNIRAPNVSVTDRSVVELATGMTYGSFVSGDNPPLYNVNGWLNDYGTSVSHYYNTRVAVSYVTGSHAFKTGLTTSSGFQDYGPGIPNFAEQYTFLNSLPAGLTQLASPGYAQTRVKANLGLFAQDQWTINRLTLNLGVRFDYLNAYNPAQTRPAGAYTPEFHFDAVSCVPCWKDLVPRVGAAYDLFGNGKTAVKIAVGQYVQMQATRVAQLTNAANSIVGTVFRTWNDSNANYVPDCDLHNPLANAECGRLANLAFGTPVVNTHFDPALLSGWDVRPHNWQATASVQHEITPGVAVTAGYYRTWYGNFFVTQNLAVAASDFGPYCITAPSDSRLPGGGGYPLCGLYDISPAKFGQVNSYVTPASNFGTLTDVYNGADIALNAKLGSRILLFGGVSLGHEVTNNCAIKDIPNVTVNAAFNTNFNAGSTEFCETRYPINQGKLAGSYALPWWGVQVSATYQNLPGIARAVSYVATNAQIAPSLGRNLGQCGFNATCNGTVTIPSLIAPNSDLEARQNQLDARFSKAMQFGWLRLRGNIDIYNVFNANSIQILNARYGATWLNASSILSGRVVKFGGQLDF